MADIQNRFPRMADADRLARLAWPAGPVRAVLDTDTFNEIDDQFALVQVLLSPERIALEAIYAAPFQNDRASTPREGMLLSYDEILRLLERLGRRPDGWVLKGVDEYVGPQKRPRGADAVDDLVARARSASAERPLYVIAIAAISNVASALLAAPDIADRMVVLWLGGHALHWPHVREFNLRQDVGAAQVVLDSGVPLVLVPCMGVVSHLHASVPEIERYVEPCGDIGEFLAARFKAYSTQHMGWSKELWDMAPVGWLLDSEWVPSVVRATPVLTDSVTWSEDAARHPMRYATHVRRNPILSDFYRKLASFAGRQ